MLLCETTQGTVAAWLWVSSACWCTIFGSGFAPRWLSLLLHCLLSDFGLICCRTAAALLRHWLRHVSGQAGRVVTQLWTSAALRPMKHAQVFMARSASRV